MSLYKGSCRKCNLFIIIIIIIRILDKKITGTLDQSNGCLIIYHEQKKDVLYSSSAQVI